MKLLVSTGAVLAIGLTLYWQTVQLNEQRSAIHALQNSIAALGTKPPEAVTIETQNKCATQARQLFSDLHFSGASYQNHYHLKTKKCILKIDIIKLGAHPAITYLLYDAYERRAYGMYSLSGKTLTVCQVMDSDGNMKHCDSTYKFDAKAKYWME